MATIRLREQRVNKINANNRKGKKGIYRINYVSFFLYIIKYGGYRT